MLRVLKAVPGVSHIVSHAPPQNMHDTQPYPFVDYQFRGDRMGFSVTKFYDHDRIGYTFATALPGIFAAPATHPDDHGTSDLERKWKTQCDADATTLYI